MIITPGGILLLIFAGLVVAYVAGAPVPLAVVLIPAALWVVTLVWRVIEQAKKDLT